MGSSDPKPLPPQSPVQNTAPCESRVYVAAMPPWEQGKDSILYLLQRGSGDYPHPDYTICGMLVPSTIRDPSFIDFEASAEDVVGLLMVPRNNVAFWSS